MILALPWRVPRVPATSSRGLSAGQGLPRRSAEDRVDKGHMEKVSREHSPRSVTSSGVEHWASASTGVDF